MRDVFFNLQCEVGVSGRLANGLMRGRGGREENELALFLTRPFTLLSRRLSSSGLIRLLPRLLLFVRSLSTFIIFCCCCLFVCFFFHFSMFTPSSNKSVPIKLSNLRESSLWDQSLNLKSKLILTAGRVLEKIKKENKNKVVNYICPIFRFATHKTLLIQVY